MTVQLKVKPVDLLKIIRRTFYPQWRTMMPYESQPADRRRAYIVGAIYIVLIVVLAIMLFKIWPPIPWPWPANVNDNDKAALAAYYTETGCPLATPSPAATPNNNQTPSPTGASNSGEAGTQTTTTAGTQPATSGTGPTGTQSTRQSGTAPPATAGTQPGGQPANQAAGSGQNTQTITPPSNGSAPSGTNGSAPSGTNPQNGVTIASGEVIRIPINLKIGSLGTCVPTTFDERLLLLVIIAGMLGAFVHGATSLADYLGNNAFNRNWTSFYLLRPAIGMALALVFYFAIRGGFLSTTGGAKDINPYGIAALAGMVGMFSKQATDKLSEIFGTLFRSAPGQGDAKRADSLHGNGIPPFTLNPTTVTAGGDAFTLTVTGTGFVNGATINLNDQPQPTTFVSATTLTAQVAKETIANAGTLKLTVVNPDQTKTGPVDFVVAVAGGAGSAGDATTPGSATPAGGDATTTGEKPVSGEGGDEDLIDGCDVEMKADTPDEDLPITEGGVKQ